MVTVFRTLQKLPQIKNLYLSITYTSTEFRMFKKIEPKSGKRKWCSNVFETEMKITAFSKNARANDKK